MKLNINIDNPLISNVVLYGQVNADGEVTGTLEIDLVSTSRPVFDQELIRDLQSMGLSDDMIEVLIEETQRKIAAQVFITNCIR